MTRLPGRPAPRSQACSCAISRSFGYDGDQSALAPEAAPHLLLEGVDAALQIGREMPGIALPQSGIAPIVARHAPAADCGAAFAVELVIGRAVAHGIVDGDLFAWLDALHGDDGHLPVEPRLRLAGVIDEVGRLVGSERRKIESLLDLHGVPSYFGLEPVQLVGLDHGPSVDGLAAGDVTILN